MYGLKPVPFTGLSFSAACKAHCFPILFGTTRSRALIQDNLPVLLPIELRRIQEILSFNPNCVILYLRQSVDAGMDARA